jgi:hypothetical protein
MRFAAALAACCLIVPITLGATPNGNEARLNVLLDAIRTASGAPYGYHVTSVIAFPNKNEPHVEIRHEMQGAAGRRRTCAGELCSGIYYSGEQVQRTNVNDTALPFLGRVDPRRITLSALESYAFDAPGFRTRGGTLQLLPSLPRDGGLLRIAVCAQHGATLEALIDPVTKLLSGARDSDRNEGGLDVAFRDQRHVGSLVLPFEISYGNTVDRFETRDIDPAPLQQPSGLVPVIAGGRTTLPFVSLERPGITPVVDCTIGTIHANCLFDTGNSGLSMSLELAERLNIEALPDSFEVHGLGSYATGIVKAPALRLGGATYPPAYYAILHDMHAYGYDLVVGADVFTHARVTFDFAARTVALSDAAPSAAEGLSLEFENFVPVARIGLGDRDTRLAIDTGDESTLNLSYDYYERFPNLFHPTSSASVSGIGGASTEVLGQIDAVRVGRYVVAHQAIGATKGMHPTADGHAGSGLLSHFIATFDYEAARLELTPRPGDAAVTASSSSERP